jgi:hypothetical protein
MNQYRCETCNKDDCDHHPNNVEYLRAVENHSLADVITSDWVAFRQFGCASHSDFQSEREKTINEFYQRLKVERDPVFDGVPWDDVDAVFIKLLEKGGE